jgi:hypothetical protein
MAAVNGKGDTLQVYLDLIQSGIEVDLSMPNLGPKRYVLNINPFLVPSLATKLYLQVRSGLPISILMRAV